MRGTAPCGTCCAIVVSKSAPESNTRFPAESKSDHERAPAVTNLTLLQRRGHATDCAEVAAQQEGAPCGGVAEASGHLQERSWPQMPWA